MGVFFSKAWQKLFGSSKLLKILIIGLNNAGKTTILYKLHLGNVVLTQPTIGSNVEEVKHKNLKLQIWDLGGQENLRPAWSTYLHQASAVIYVVDSNDLDNILLARMELFNVLLHDSLKHVPLLILANKQDIQSAKTASEICVDLNLHAIKDHEWHIQGCCALDGVGLTEGLDWLSEKLKEKA